MKRGISKVFIVMEMASSTQKKICKRKKVVCSVVGIFLLGFICVTVYFTGKDKAEETNNTSKSYVSNLIETDKRNNNSGIVSRSEVYCTTPEIIGLSKVIVKGKLTRLLGEYTYVCTDAETGEEDAFKRYLYEFGLEDVLKGNPDDNMKISMSNFVQENEYTVGEEYIWCLQQINGDYEGAYDCISYKQSLFKIENNILRRNGDENEEITLDEFKDLIETNNEDAEFKEDENSVYNKITDSETYEALYVQ